MRFLYMILISMIFIGCSSSSIDSLWERNSHKKDYRFKLLKTQKAIVYDTNNNIQASLVATYVTLAYTPDNKEEFIVSFYTADSKDIFDKNSKYYLKLNGTNPIKIEQLDSNDTRLKDISFKTAWKNYYFVTFEHLKSETLYLKFGLKNTSEVKLYFAKRSKYIYD